MLKKMIIKKCKSSLYLDLLISFRIYDEQSERNGIMNDVDNDKNNSEEVNSNFDNMHRDFFILEEKNKKDLSEKTHSEKYKTINKMNLISNPSMIRIQQRFSQMGDKFNEMNMNMSNTMLENEFNDMKKGFKTIIKNNENPFKTNEDGLELSVNQQLSKHSIDDYKKDKNNFSEFETFKKKSFKEFGNSQKTFDVLKSPNYGCSENAQEHIVQILNKNNLLQNNNDLLSPKDYLDNESFHLNHDNKTTVSDSINYTVDNHEHNAFQIYNKIYYNNKFSLNKLDDADSHKSESSNEITVLNFKPSQNNDFFKQ